MRNLNDLLNRDEPGIDLLRHWAAAAEVPVEILPPSARRTEVLVALHVTTRSPLGALAYDTGGVLVDNGWLRFLGSGHPRLRRDLDGWNRGRSDGFLLVADDAVGGFFALNGGALGPDQHQVYYWPPDGLDWLPLEMGFSEFFQWALTEDIRRFFGDLKWAGWERDLATLQADACFSFFPFLWTTQGSVEGSYRGPVSASEAFDFKVEALRQLQANGGESADGS